MISPLAETGKAIMEEQYASLYGTADVAGQLGVSVEHFIRLFKEGYGVSPHQFLLSLKLERGRELLSIAELEVDTVATSVGFSGGNYFAKVFKKTYGITPTQYKESHPPQTREEGELYL